MPQQSHPDSVSTRPRHDLLAAIESAIGDAGGWLPFDRFMAMALYQPGLGYYANGSPKFGLMPASGSDFVTAPEMSPLFGRALAVQVAQGLAASGTDEVTEFGAGSGALAEQVLDALEALGRPVSRYSIVELSAGLRARQRERLARFGDRVRWLEAWPEAIDGVVLGNEVLDAMPVQLVHFDGRQWWERGVVVATPGGGEGGPHGAPASLAFGDRPTTQCPPVDGPFAPGTVTELHTQARAWTASLAQRLRRGLVVLIDYGFPEAEYYHPQRTGGTLMCHRAHQADVDPLADVGAKDITAHVDFTGIALAAQEAGAQIVGYTSQARFLVNCGIAAMMDASPLRERIMAQRLITEHEMGELFKVLAFARGCEIDPLGFAQGDRMHRL